MIQVRTEIVGTRLRLFAEYSTELLRRVRAVGGKWQSSAYWEFPLESGLRLVKEHFGTSEETVRVRVKCTRATTELGWEEMDSFVMLGGYVLASRNHRDNPVHFREDMMVGSAPAYGGSVKYPRVNLSNDAEFELEVRKDFAEAHGLKIIPALPNASETHPEKKVGLCLDPYIASLMVEARMLLAKCLTESKGNRIELVFSSEKTATRFKEVVGILALFDLEHATPLSLG